MNNKYWILLVLVPTFLQFLIFLYDNYITKKEFAARMEKLEHDLGEPDDL